MQQGQIVVVQGLAVIDRHSGLAAVGIGRRLDIDRIRVGVVRRRQIVTPRSAAAAAAVEAASRLRRRAGIPPGGDEPPPPPPAVMTLGQSFKFENMS